MLPPTRTANDLCLQPACCSRTNVNRCMTYTAVLATIFMSIVLLPYHPKKPAFVMLKRPCQPSQAIANALKAATCSNTPKLSRQS